MSRSGQWIIMATLLGVAACSSSDPPESTYVAPIGEDTPGCQAVPIAERHAALLAMHADTDHPISCTDDSNCPCGAYCSGTDGVCEVSCFTQPLDADPANDLGCDASQACTPLGRCATAANTPPPPRLALSLVTSPVSVAANTSTGAVVIPVTVSVDANSLDFLQPEHPAIVKYHFVGIDDPRIPVSPTNPVEPNPPKVKCTSGAAFTTSCEIDGGWAFNPQSGSLHSAPRTIWVQLPQTTENRVWTLEARSDWAQVPATTRVETQPTPATPTDPGHYTGTATWDNVGSAQADQKLKLAIQAIVTPTRIALFEPTRALLSDGHVVLSRDPSQSTLTGWLASGSHRYDVRFDLGTPSYDANLGQLTASLTVTDGNGVPTVISLALLRDGDSTAASCAAGCATGTYCEPAMNVCLPGSAPAPGAGIVSRASATPSGDLASAELEAWRAPLVAVQSGSPTQLGAAGALDRVKFDAAYCFVSPGQAQPAQFAVTSALQTPSFDLGCHTPGGADYAQPTFAYANVQKEVSTDAQTGQTVELLDSCLADLAVQPTGPVTAANLLANKPCASLGRFFLAMLATSSDLPITPVRMNMFRQWLGVNAFVANTLVQEAQFDDLLGIAEQPAQSRLGSALDLVDQGLAVALSPNGQGTFQTNGLDPEYRACTSWDHNTTGDALDVTLVPLDLFGPQYETTCFTQKGKKVCSPEVSTFTSDCNSRAAAERAARIPNIFADAPASVVSAFTLTGVLIHSTSPPGGPVGFTGGAEANVSEGTDFYQCRFQSTNFPVPVTAVKPACHYTANGTAQPLPLPGDEQTTGLPAHLLEAIDADLNLLSAYLGAEANVIYPDCYQGLPSAALDRALGRAGHNLRLMSVLTNQAIALASAPAAATKPWFARYQADLQKLAGSRARAYGALAAVTACRNPLGIGEDDLPLYVGDGTSLNASAQFFAGSRFLAQDATTEIELASAALGKARDAYNAQRQQAFQETQANVNTEDRIRGLRLTYEATLRRYCGAPPSDDGAQPEQQLLDGFLAGTYSTKNCFLKLENPSCAALVNAPVQSIPSTCLRGEIGEKVLAIQAAVIDADNAQSSLNRAIEDYDDTDQYCARRQAMANDATALLQQHQDAMTKLRKKAQSSGWWSGALKAAGNVVTAIVTKGAAAGGAIDSLTDLAFKAHTDGIANDTAAEEDSYQLEVLKRQGEADVMACYQTVDAKRFAIQAATDVITRAGASVHEALATLEDDGDQVTATANEAAGQLTLETTIDRTPPHLHYWLDEDIKTYQQEMSYARRLTYLAVRALEYEAQETLNLRGSALTARNPEDLRAVIQSVSARNAPFQGEEGFTIGHTPQVLSLRDEILRLDGLATNTTPPPGSPATTATDVLKQFLTSDASKIFDQLTGQYLGRGLRFSLKPDFWSENMCAERIWRITPSVQFAGNAAPAHTGLTLYQENAFGSQVCGDLPGTVQLGRVQPTHNLLLDDTSISFLTPVSTTALAIDGPPDNDAIHLGALADNGALGFASGFAGRGLYGNYVLLFPKCVSPACTGTQGYSDQVIASILDVLIRFDIVFVTNGGAP